MIVHSGQGAYAVEFVSMNDLKAQLENYENAVVLIDENVARLYCEPLIDFLNCNPVRLLPATEVAKEFSGITTTVQTFQNLNVTKQTTVIAIGGGIIQDIACFASHIYHRGLKWIYVPTTLLGMADSCIGAKCGINFGGYKNQIGVFHSPSRVLICQDFLNTLPNEDVLNGFGEILKLALTGSRKRFVALQKAVSDGGLRNPQLNQLIYDSLATKRFVIQEDEYELDQRRILNYGHTIGHALEAVTDNTIPHGKAVAFGIDIANFISLSRGLLCRSEYDSIHTFIQKYFGECPDIDSGVLVEAMKRDKKMEDDKLNLILLKTAGDLRIVPTILDAVIKREIDLYLSQQNVVLSRN